MGQAFPKEPYVGKRNWATTRKAFKRDKANFQGYYTCNKCQRNFKEIEVDHILGRGSHPHLIHDLTNLQLLCHECHQRKTDHKN